MAHKLCVGKCDNQFKLLWAARFVGVCCRL